MPCAADHAVSRAEGGHETELLQEAQLIDLNPVLHHLSVPEVRQRVLAGQASMDEAFQAARAAGRLSAGAVDDLEQAMGQFAATLRR